CACGGIHRNPDSFRQMRLRLRLAKDFFGPLAERSLEEFRPLLNWRFQLRGQRSTPVQVLALAVWKAVDCPHCGWRPEQVAGPRDAWLRAFGRNRAASRSYSGRNERYHATASRASHKTACPG